ncbi:MAG TPA: phosphatidate cytidylyltransferase [Atribacteraceae bacterium]|nr:phosphatidate cytidylyltransferase [Atribacteraceae bacterium]
MAGNRRLSETVLRALLIVYALPPFVFLVLFSEWTLLFLFLILSVLGFQEYLKLVIITERGIRSPWFYPIPIALVYVPLTVFGNGLPLALWWYILFLWIVLWGLLRPDLVRERIAWFAFGILYCVFLPSFWVKAGLEASRIEIVAYALIIWSGDIGAYLVGSRWGKCRFVPAISPRKSLEGLLGGTLAAGIAGMLFTLFLIPGRSLWEGLGIGILLCMVAFLGDLLESSLKRKAGVKDSGRLFPGHGGVLDRFDAFFLAGPAIYFLAVYWGGRP